MREFTEAISVLRRLPRGGHVRCPNARLNTKWAGILPPIHRLYSALLTGRQAALLLVLALLAAGLLWTPEPSQAQGSDGTEAPRANADLQYTHRRRL